MDPEALRWRKIPWHNIPQLSRAGVLPFLSVQDNVELNVALLIDEECRDDYLLSHKNKNGLPAYDNWVYTDTDTFKGLRRVMKNGIKLNTLRMRVGEEGVSDRDQVLWWLVDKQHDDIAREYVRINTDVRDVEASEGYYRSTTLRRASQHGYLKVVNALISTGADVNKADIYGWTPLSWASFNGYTPISRASLHGHLKIVQVLVAAGADLNKADNGGVTPISAAPLKGHLEVVQALIVVGAHVDDMVTMYGDDNRSEYEQCKANAFQILSSYYFK
jgi:ankyrin repeat protein